MTSLTRKKDYDALNCLCFVYSASAKKRKAEIDPKFCGICKSVRLKFLSGPAPKKPSHYVTSKKSESV